MEGIRLRRARTQRGLESGIYSSTIIRDEGALEGTSSAQEMFVCIISVDEKVWVLANVPAAFKYLSDVTFVNSFCCM